MDETDKYISRLSKAERDFYEECAEMDGCDFKHWIKHMFEIPGTSKEELSGQVTGRLQSD